MAGLTEFFKILYNKICGKGEIPSSVQDLRAAFASRYHNFKLLLTANNKTLEIMSDMEKALEGIQPFGMSFVRSNCTAVSVNVYRIVKSLNELAPGKYGELHERFRVIQDSINETLSHRTVPRGQELVLPLEAIDDSMVDQVGSKMANVAAIENEVGLPVP